MVSWTSVVVCLIILNVVTGQMKFPATKEEIEICKSKAIEKEYLEAYKKRRLVCKVQCVYKKVDGETEEEEVNSPNGQKCCEAGGVPTGVCDDGKCPPSPKVVS